MLQNPEKKLFLSFRFYKLSVFAGIDVTLKGIENHECREFGYI